MRHFVWARRALLEQHPSLVLPHLPDKRWWKGFDPSHIGERRLSLARWLTVTSNHPVVATSPILRILLRGSDKEVLSLQKAQNREEELGASEGV